MASIHRSCYAGKKASKNQYPDEETNGRRKKKREIRTRKPGKGARLTIDVHGLGLLTLADGVVHFAFDDLIIHLASDLLQPELRAVIASHDVVVDEPSIEGYWQNLISCSNIFQERGQRKSGREK